MKKKILILITCLLIVILLIYKFTNKKLDQEVDVNISSPNIPDSKVFKGPISVNISQDKFNFPNQLPLLKRPINKSLSKDEVVTYAKNIGFDEDFSTFDDVELGIIYFWNKKEESLTIYPKTSHIVYIPPISNQILDSNKTQEILTKTVKDFIINKKIAEESSMGSSILYNYDSDDEFSHLTTFEKAIIHKLAISPNINNHEIVSLSPQDSFINIYVDKYNRILKIETTQLGQLDESIYKYDTKNYEDFVSSINNSVIMEIDNGNILPQDINISDVKSVSIEDLRLAYLLRTDKDLDLYPYFIIEGQIIVNDNLYQAILYLPALK